MTAGQGSREEDPNGPAFSFAKGNLSVLGSLAPVGGPPLKVPDASHLYATLKQPEPRGPSETCVLPAGEQRVA